MYITPLRYPGGKGRLIKFMEQVIVTNSLEGGVYMEPFAGGASVALKLLYNKKVSKIYINDYDPAIYSFWKAVCEETDRFIEKIKDTPVNITEWKKQKKIYKSNSKQEYSFDLGFAAIYMNRCNFSGVLKGGPIGGITQKGNYKIDARFNKDDLIKRIEKIAEMKNNIYITNEDALDFIKQYVKTQQEKTLVYLDPPYYNKGAWLYCNFYKHDDHLNLSKAIKGIQDQYWVLSYDNCSEIQSMYSHQLNNKFKLGYSAHQNTKSGQEFIFWHDKLVDMNASMALLPS